MQPLLLVPIFLLLVPFATYADIDMENLLPPLTCGAGWKIDGKPIFYDRETLSDRINGESELYFPYGFNRLAAVRYASEKIPGGGMDVEIYRMGSLLDAFGMYANYQQKAGLTIGIGAESNLSGSQLFFYQGRHFVHIQVTGADIGGSNFLTECAQSVEMRLPGTRNRPSELSAFDQSGVVKGTERYLPQSLLGYDFLNRGIMADAVADGTNFQIFRLISTTANSSAAAFDRYHAMLGQVKAGPVEKGAASYEGIDPLYGPVLVLKKGDCLAGALRFSSSKRIRALLESVCR